MTALDIAYPIAWVVLFIISATFHEAAHAWIAKKGGDSTAYAGGQVSLNPLPHIKREPLGMVVFPLVSSFVFGWPFGYASAPYDPVWAYKHPRKAALMAAAGPFANLLILVLCAAIVKLGILSGVFLSPDSVNSEHIMDVVSGPQGLATLVSMIFTLNLIMFTLNLLPIPPLDGSNVIALFLPEDTARKYQKVISNPAFGFIGFMLAWRIFDPLFDVIFVFVINILHWPIQYS